MLINWDGKTYSLDFAELTLHQAEVIEKETGAPLEEWLDAIGEGTRKLQSLRLLYWVMLAQNGEEAPVGTVDFPLIKFSQAFTAAAGSAEPAPGAPDPTPGPSSPPASPSPPDPPAPGTSPNGMEGAPATVS